MCCSTPPEPPKPAGDDKPPRGTPHLRVVK
jgi:hypothetical protein